MPFTVGAKSYVPRAVQINEVASSPLDSSSLVWDDSLILASELLAQEAGDPVVRLSPAFAIALHAFIRQINSQLLLISEADRPTLSICSKPTEHGEDFYHSTDSLVFTLSKLPADKKIAGTLVAGIKDAIRDQSFKYGEYKPVENSCVFVVSGLKQTAVLTTGSVTPYLPSPVDAAYVEPHLGVLGVNEEPVSADLLGWGQLVHVAQQDTISIESLLPTICQIYGNTSAGQGALVAFSKVASKSIEATTDAPIGNRLLIDRLDRFAEAAAGTGFQLAAEGYSFAAAKRVHTDYSGVRVPENEGYIHFIDTFPGSPLVPIAEQMMYARDFQKISEELKAHKAPSSPSASLTNLCDSFLKDNPSAPQWLCVSTLRSQLLRQDDDVINKPSAADAMSESNAKRYRGQAIKYYRDLGALVKHKSFDDLTVATAATAYLESDSAQYILAKISHITELMADRYAQTDANLDLLMLQQAIETNVHLKHIDTHVKEINATMQHENDKLIVVIQGEFELTRRTLVAALSDEHAKLRASLAQNFDLVNTALASMGQDLRDINAGTQQLIIVSNDIASSSRAIAVGVDKVNSQLAALDAKVTQTTDAVNKVVSEVQGLREDVGALRNDVKNSSFPGLAELRKAGRDISAGAKKAGGDAAKAYKNVKKKLFGLIQNIFDRPIVLYDFRTRGVVSMNLATLDVNANLGLPGGNVTIQDLINGNPIPKLEIMSVAKVALGGKLEASNDYESRLASLATDYPDSHIYLSSRSFVEKMSTEAVASDVGNGIITGGTSVESTARGYVDLFRSECRTVGVWIQNIGISPDNTTINYEKLASGIVLAGFDNGGSSVGGIKVLPQKINYRYTATFFEIPGRLQSVFKAIGLGSVARKVPSALNVILPHAGFVIVIPKSLFPQAERQLASEYAKQLLSKRAELANGADGIWQSAFDLIPGVGQLKLEVVNEQLNALNQRAMIFLGNYGLSEKSLQDALEESLAKAPSLNVGSEIDLAHTQLSQSLSTTLGRLAQGNDSSAVVQEFTLDPKAGTVNLIVELRHRHVWGSLSDLPGDIRGCLANLF